MNPFDAVLRAGAHQFRDRGLRDSEALPAAIEQQRRHDRQGQRDLDGETRSATEAARDFDSPADLLDIAAHDIEADAAARNIRYLRRGGKAGMEDELQQLMLAHRSQLGIAGEAAAADRGANTLGIDATPIIRQSDDDRAAFLA